MSISIRAGLLSGLCVQELSSINNKIVQDVLYINNCLKHLIEFSYYHFIRTTFKPGGNTTGDSRDCAEVFPIYASEFEQRLLADGFTKEELAIVLGKFTDMKDICASSGFFVVDNWVTSAGKPGVVHENIAIRNLSKLGFVISEGVHSSKVMDFGGINIQLNGKPDGVIVSSPGNSIVPGTVVEIKLKNRNGRNNQWRDEFQLCAYGVIFEVDVLYVVIYGEKNMECTLYRNSRLLEIWNSKKNSILGNSIKLHKLISNYSSDPKSASELIGLASYK